MDRNNASLLIQRRKAQLLAKIEDLGRGGFNKVSRDLNVSKGALWKFINTDYVPTGVELLRKLGLPEPIIIYRTRNPRGQFESYEEKP